MTEPPHSHDDGVDAVNGAYVGDDTAPEDDLEWPVGFMVVLGMAALYLGWRLIQLVGGLFDFIG